MYVFVLRPIPIHSYTEQEYHSAPETRKAFYQGTDGKTLLSKMLLDSEIELCTNHSTIPIGSSFSNFIFLFLPHMFESLEKIFASGKAGHIQQYSELTPSSMLKRSFGGPGTRLGLASCKASASPAVLSCWFQKFFSCVCVCMCMYVV